MASQNLHKACDSCRSRKLKCSQQRPKCARCQEENLECVYSIQSKMGRPRKRPRPDEPDRSTSTQSINSISPPQPEPLSQAETFGSGPDLTQDIYSNFVHPGVLGYFDQSISAAPAPDLLAQEHQMISDALNEVFGPEIPPLPSTGLDPSLVDPMLQMSPHVETSSAASNSLLEAYTSGMPSENYSIFEGTTPYPHSDHCDCLTKIHLMLSELQHMTNFGFPVARISLENGKRVAAEVLHCNKCMSDGGSAMQNTMLLTTLLSVLLERYRKVLVTIEEEAARKEAIGGTIPFRMGDSSPEVMHLHTGTLDCPMGFNIDLAPSEWKYLAKRIIKQDVKGDVTTGALTPDKNIVGLVTQLEERQRNWHEEWHSQGNCIRCWSNPGELGQESESMASENCPHNNPQGEDPNCVRVTQFLRSLLDWMEM